MGSIASPSVYMEKSEITYINQEIYHDSFFYARYIDSIFLMYTGREEKQNNFLTKFNMMHH